MTHLTSHMGWPLVTQCPICGEKLQVRVLRSNAGFYIGTQCGKCGPVDRSTGYFPNREVAQLVLEQNQ